MLTALLTVVVLIILGLAAVLSTAYYPKKLQQEHITQRSDKPLLSHSPPFKVLSYNVQFMAGKDYVFWFDVPNADGPDNAPSDTAIKRTTEEVARIIIDECADFVFLQEIDDGAKRSGQQDQLAALLNLLPEDYAYHTSAFYWKSGFVPHPRVLGRAGMKLSILSKHPIASAKRHQLALTPDNIIAKHLGIKRAILEARIPFCEGGELVLMNTHLEAFSKQSDTLQKQVDYVHTLLTTLTKAKTPWVIGGDFNLLPPKQYSTLPLEQRVYYRPDTELTHLTNDFSCIPSLTQLEQEPENSVTFYSNDPNVTEADRTLDYLFYSPKLSCCSNTIRRHDTGNISDHYPVIATFKYNVM